MWKARATCSANCVRVAPERSSFNWNDSTKRNAEIQCVAVVCDHVRQEDLRVESENWADGRVVTEQSIGVGEAMNETLVRVVVSLDNGLDLGEELGEFGLHDGAAGLSDEFRSAFADAKVIISRMPRLTENSDAIRRRPGLMR